MELKELFEQLQIELRGFITKANEEMKATGTVATETKSAIDALNKRLDGIEVKMSAPQGGLTQPTLEDELKQNESVQRLMRDHSGRAVITLKGNALAEFQRKAVIDSATVGYATSGVLQIDRTAGIVAEARRALRIRDMLASRPTERPVLDFIRVVTALCPGSPQEEGSPKYENEVTFTTEFEKVKLLATWIPATRQVIEDFTELLGFLRTSLPYYVNVEEETQLLVGDGTGENLNGLVTQAVPFDVSLLVDVIGWTYIDIIGRAVQQIVASNEIAPSFVVLNPNDWWDIRLTKDTFGRYILGDPQSVVRPTLFGLDVVSTSALTEGTFLVGSGEAAASEIRDRSEMTVEISTEHEDYFTHNKIAIRAEKRVALVVYRPNSYVSGALSLSPA